MEVLNLSFATSSFRFHHTKVMEQNEDGGPHAPTMRKSRRHKESNTNKYGIQKESESARLPISQVMSTGEERRTRKSKNNGSVPYDTTVRFVSITNSADNNLKKMYHRHVTYPWKDLTHLGLQHRRG